tara:strand:- start:138 stop:647 length:510 start_codon:yes stop_codon:yes gene_type:complete
MDDILKEATSQKNNILKSMKTVILGTIDSNSNPNSSYAPSVIDENGDFFIYISKLSKHTRNLLKNPAVSIMIIEDEEKSENIFARKRFTINAQSKEIIRDSDIWNEKILLMEKKFGESISFLKNLTDFYLFKLKPRDGLLVHGFARAFKFKGQHLDEIDYLNDQGHTQK